MNDPYSKAMLGSLIADAVAMPVHWYYNSTALAFCPVDKFIDLVRTGIGDPVKFLDTYLTLSVHASHFR